MNLCKLIFTIKVLCTTKHNNYFFNFMVEVKHLHTIYKFTMLIYKFAFHNYHIHFYM